MALQILSIFLIGFTAVTLSMAVIVSVTAQAYDQAFITALCLASLASGFYGGYSLAKLIYARPPGGRRASP